jgi:hypothetical protein
VSPGIQLVSFLLLNSIPMHDGILFIHSPVEGYLGYSQFSVIMDRAVLSICVQILYAYTFSFLLDST